MKTTLSLLFAAFFVFSLSMDADAFFHRSGHDNHGAQHQEKDGKNHGHHDDKAAAHDAHDAHAHDAHEEMYDLGSLSVDGVKGNAHISDVREAMAAVGMAETHHFMIHFMDEASGDSIEEGTVAVRIVNPAGEQSAPIRLIGMDGHFGADIILEDKGTYHFTVGSALPDEKRRQYEFSFDYE
ncbi:hypothetical protein [Geoalkalibacter halelectricus]|uniref:Uncharacterized protein n=1 Tax=Geoalkalibacter halelectricus TaxID=2847045 RepID=A0ABY5ZN42_9BACT|nr:hypothetical protein [Geoalkalibacter halelectricus]MDO3379908.1 hypothetical protein [Geoalkalibacter halelectricus]UWZ80565.1 hypothetical protein L9S41_03980 [Geoalkalibacter halelectricus]